MNSGLVNTADSTPSSIDMNQMVPVTIDGVTTQVTLQEEVALQIILSGQGT